MIGGEKFPLNLLETIKDKTHASIYNMYGPTEATVWTTISDLTHKAQVTIGTSLKGA